MEKTAVELFCGYGVISKFLERAGFKTWKTDIRKRKGVCMPDLKKDIMQLSRKEIPFEKVSVLWASLPCDCWSYAAGSFHWKDGQPKTQKCLDHIEMLKKTLELIDEIKPEIFFIENPRGKLRYFPEFMSWMEKHHAVCKTLTYSSYGFPATKPTNIFTNCKIDFRPLAKFGRGAKVNFKLDNIAVGQKQKIPEDLAKEISKFLKILFSSHQAISVRQAEKLN